MIESTVADGTLALRVFARTSCRECLQDGASSERGGGIFRPIVKAGLRTSGEGTPSATYPPRYVQARTNSFELVTQVQASAILSFVGPVHSYPPLIVRCRRFARRDLQLISAAGSARPMPTI